MAKRRFIAGIWALVGFGLGVYGFEGASQITGVWGRVPLLGVPLYWFMGLSNWTYWTTELVISVVLAVLFWRWAMWWLKAMDRSGEQERLRKALEKSLREAQRHG